MNLVSILLIVLVAVGFVAAVRAAHKGGCCGNGSHCSGHCSHCGECSGKKDDIK